MSYISKGDLISVRWWDTSATLTWRTAVAVSDDYIRSVPGTGEYVEDFTFVPSVAFLVPDTGLRGVARLSEVKKL